MELALRCVLCYSVNMSMKGQKQKIRQYCADAEPEHSREALAEAAAFLAKIESRRRAYQPDSTALTPLQQRLAREIEAAFADVPSPREERVLLAAEAEDDYVSRDAQAVLARYEEREDWHAIPDDLLFACSCSLVYAGPEAYRFLVPRFMLGALHGVVEMYPGCKPNDAFIPHMREQMKFLSPAQQQCLSDFLNFDRVDEEEQTCFGRNTFLPWELDEYEAHYAGKLSYREYGAMLVKVYGERVGLGKMS